MIAQFGAYILLVVIILHMTQGQSSSYFSGIIHTLFRKLSVSPAKTYFWSQFYRDLEDHSDVDIAADIASSSFKNAAGFNSDEYVGVDIDRERLREGKSTVDTDTHSAVQADIRKVNFHPSSFDLITSTHTIHHLQSEERLPFVRTLIDYLSTGGDLFIQFQPGQFTDNIERLVRDVFDKVQIETYDNVVSRSFNSLRSRTNWLDSFDMDSWKRYPQVAVVLVITLLEFAPAPGQKRTYVRCFGKNQ